MAVGGEGDFGNELIHHLDKMKMFLQTWSADHETLLKQYLVSPLRLQEGGPRPVPIVSHLLAPHIGEPGDFSTDIHIDLNVDEQHGHGIDEELGRKVHFDPERDDIYQSRSSDAENNSFHEIAATDSGEHGESSANTHSIANTYSAPTTMSKISSRFSKQSLHSVLQRGRSSMISDAAALENVVLENQFMKMVMESKFAIAIRGCVALANALVVTLSAQQSLCIPTDVGCGAGNELVALKALETVFAVFFVIELGAKICVYGRWFFLGHDCLWRMIDCVLVGSAILSTLMYVVRDLPSVPNLSYIRAVKFLNVLWVTQVGQFLQKSPQLRLLRMLAVESVLGLGISMSIAIFVVYVFAVFVVQVVSFHFHMNAEIAVNLRESLFHHWGSVQRSMLRLGMAVTGGEDWRNMASPLYDVSFLLYASFLSFIGFFIFVISNLIAAIFIQATMKVMNNARGLRIRMHMESFQAYTDRFVEAFRMTHITFKMFQYQLDAREDEGMRSVQEFCEKLDIGIDEVIHLMYILSGAGKHNVMFGDLVYSCIQCLDTPTKMDLVDMLVRQEQHLGSRLVDASLHGRAQSQLNSTSMLQSLPLKRELEIREVSKDDFVEKVLDACMTQQRHLFSPHAERQEFLKTVRSLLNVVMHAKGGGGFLATSLQTLRSLQIDTGVDFQVVDRDARWPKGYMTAKMCDVHVSDKQFLNLIEDFTDHHLDENDRWPTDHEASGLPKDGFTILDANGRVKRGAVRLVGLPTPPYRWDSVGTRHLAALAIAWALCNKSAIVVVRSDSGKIHVLCPLHESLQAFRVIV